MTKLLLLPVLAALLSACGSSQKDADTLSEAIRSYNDGMRWQRFEIAASQLPPKGRGEWVNEMDERAEDIRITDYDIIKVEGRGTKEAKVQVKVSWYKDSEGTLHETHALQTWEQHGKDWWMVEETRVRGAEMPGLTEPAEEPATHPGPGTKSSLLDQPQGSDAPRSN